MRDAQEVLTRRSALLVGGGAVALLFAGCSNPGGEPNSSKIDLTFRDNRKLTGTFAGLPVTVATDLPQGTGKAAGSFVGKPVDVDWKIAYNDTAQHIVLPVALQGTVAGVSTSLNGNFRHAPNFFFESGTISGTAGGAPVQAQARRASGKSSSSIDVQGSFAGTAFSLYATLSLSEVPSGYVQGTVSGKPVRIDAKVRSGVVELTGNYSGPSDLLALIVGSLLYFIPGGIYS